MVSSGHRADELPFIVELLPSDQGCVGIVCVRLDDAALIHQSKLVPSSSYTEDEERDFTEWQILLCPTKESDT